MDTVTRNLHDSQTSLSLSSGNVTSYLHYGQASSLLPSSSFTAVTSNINNGQTGAESLTSSGISCLYGCSSAVQTHVHVIGEASTSQLDSADRIMIGKVIEMFPATDIQLIEEAVHDSIELEDAVDIVLNHNDEKSSGKFESCK